MSKDKQNQGQQSTQQNQGQQSTQQNQGQQSTQQNNLSTLTELIQLDQTLLVLERKSADGPVTRMVQETKQTQQTITEQRNNQANTFEE